SRLVSFDVVLPWSEPGEIALGSARTLGTERGLPERPGAVAYRLSDASLLIATIVAWVGGVILARRNMRGKRGDRRGAYQIAVFLFVILIGEWLLAANHVASLQNEWDLLMAGMGHALFWAISVWIVYMALEPYVRRRWPQVLISWTRLLRGGFADPLVGRDLLIGILFGIGVHLMVRVEYLVPLLFGRPLPPPLAGGFPNLAPARLFASTVLRAQFAGLRDALGVLFLLLLVRVLIRRQAIAVGVLALAFSFVVLFWVEPLFVYWPLAILRATFWILLTLRVGLLAGVVAMTVWYELVQLPLRLDTAWLAGPTLFILLLFVALIFYGFRTTLAGQPFFGATPLDE
ncbi:MAG TPA: hypothetical protein VEO37_06670, partial [Thermoanaerobaculia bacterium]|nr:hypothetical protein [Thermoanaerobaculia bacterium]